MGSGHTGPVGPSVVTRAAMVHSIGQGHVTTLNQPMAGIYAMDQIKKLMCVHPENVPVSTWADHMLQNFPFSLIINSPSQERLL